MSLKPLPVYVWSLGCPKNRADTERLLGSLGIPIRTVSKIAHARAVFINTCAFIESATRESLRAIFDTASHIGRLKRKPLLIVAGCLPGRYGKLEQQIPEVDLWLDSASIASWPEQILKALDISTCPVPGRLQSTPSYMWLKIAEGCRHQCAFCTIPSIRGPLKSEPLSDLLAEADAQIKGGIKEIILVAQDVTSWGHDLGLLQADGLPTLVRHLAGLPGLAWLRLMYLHPASITDALLETMASGAPILPYLDIPFQHCQQSILKNMGRPFKADPRLVLAKVRSILPQAAVRATLMTGFPGETEADFMALCDFVREARFQNLGVFAFEAEEGTRAALMPNQVPPEIRQERRDTLMAIQKDISAELLAAYPGRQMEVLIDKSLDEEWPGLCQGRVWFQAPEVDGLTYISGDGISPGELLCADIADATEYDLSALA